MLFFAHVFQRKPLFKTFNFPAKKLRGAQNTHAPVFFKFIFRSYVQSGVIFPPKNLEK